MRMMTPVPADYTFILVAEQMPGYLKLNRAEKSEAAGAHHCFAAIESVLTCHERGLSEQDLPFNKVLRQSRLQHTFSEAT